MGVALGRLMALVIQEVEAGTEGPDGAYGGVKEVMFLREMSNSTLHYYLEVGQPFGQVRGSSVLELVVAKGISCLRGETVGATIEEADAAAIV